MRMGVHLALQTVRPDKEIGSSVGLNRDEVQQVIVEAGKGSEPVEKKSNRRR